MILMEIQILQLLEGARQARGLTVIIDVFRAFSTACYAYDLGAAKLIPVGSIETARKLKNDHPHYILMGERNEQKPDGFDFGNSPSLLDRKRIQDKTIIHTTSSGTQGIEGAAGAHEIITGSFVNAGAIVRYIRQNNPESVSLVCMGYACLYPTDEDTLCAEYILGELTGNPADFDHMIRIIRNGSGARFFEPQKQSWSPQADFDLCLQRNRFNFILKVVHEEEYNWLQKIDV